MKYFLFCAFILTVNVSLFGQVNRPGINIQQDKKDPDAVQWVHELKYSIPGVEYRTFNSASMKKKVGYALYLPKEYNDNNKRYHVIYWLHGIGGNESQSSRHAKYMSDYADKGKEPMIMVFVNGAVWSMYMDSYDGKVMVETSIIKELIPHIDSTLRTVDNRAGRHIERFSMGGFGAIRLAFKYPEMFSSVMAYAPAVLTPEALQKSHADIVKIMFGSDSDKSEKEVPYFLLKKNLELIKKNLKIRIVVGTKDIVYQGAKFFHEYLLENNVMHEYIEPEDLTHVTGPYYDAFGEQGFDFHYGVKGGK